MARPALTAGAQWRRILATLPAFVAIFFLGQAILDRYGWRLDLTPEQRYTLSEHGKRALQLLDRPVRVLAFLRSQDPRNPAIEDLLRQVQGVAPRIQVERFDINRSPGLAQEYGVDVYGALAVEFDGRRRVFANPTEELLVAAIQEVTRRERRIVGWSVGHGEGDLESSDRRQGYSNAQQALEGGYFAVRPIALLDGDVPDDIDVLAIVGPVKEFLPPEIERLERYLQSGRALLLCLGPLRAEGLATRLAKYGVLLSDDVVVESAGQLYGGEALTLRAEMNRTSQHPLAAAMGAGPLLSRSRSVDVAPDAKGASLLASSRDSFATRDVEAATAGRPQFDPQRDRRGPISLGVETLTPVAPGPDGVERSAHLIVYGNAVFASNFFLDYLGNRDLLLNSVSWLARDRERIGAGTQRRTPGTQQFFMSESDGALAFWTTAVLQPAVLLVIGVVIALRRRFGGVA